MFASVGDWVRCAVANTAGDGVEKRETLNKKEIDAEGNVAVMFKNGCGDVFCNKRGRTRRGVGMRRLALQRSDVRAIDDESSLCVARCDWAVPDGVAL